MIPPPIAETFRLLEWKTDPPDWCDPLGLYAETYWLPILYPGGYLLGRRLVMLWNRHVGRNPDAQLELRVADLTPALGFLNHGAPRFARVVDRLFYRKLVNVRGDSVMEIKTRWPRLPEHQLAKLPPAMQMAEPEYWEIDGSARAPFTLAL